MGSEERKKEKKKTRNCTARFVCVALFLLFVSPCTYVKFPTGRPIMFGPPKQVNCPSAFKPHVAEGDALILVKLLRFKGLVSVTLYESVPQQIACTRVKK